MTRREKINFLNRIAKRELTSEDQTLIFQEYLQGLSDEEIIRISAVLLKEIVTENDIKNDEHFHENLKKILDRDPVLKQFNCNQETWGKIKELVFS